MALAACARACVPLESTFSRFALMFIVVLSTRKGNIRRKKIKRKKRSEIADRRSRKRIDRSRLEARRCTKGQSSKEQRVRLREGSTMRAVPYVHCGPLAQNENLVCKARVRIRLYERFPRFLHFVLVLSQARSVTIQGWAQGFGIKDAADHIKAREYL